MPIPQMTKKNNQSWRNNKKQYYMNKLKSKADSALRADAFKGIKRRKIGGFSLDSLFNKDVKAKLKKYTFMAIAGFVLFVILVLLWFSSNLPDPDQLIEREVAQTTKIYDRTGEELIYEIHGEEKRTLVNLNEIPEYVKKATIAIEDKNFYEHGGISVWAIFRTVVTNIFTGRKAGGSTLTQQFIKNAVLTNEKKYSRKIKEIMLAYKVEKNFTKDEILQMYLNEIPYGSNAYGVEAASQKYFGKSVRDINLAEAAILAALPQAPSKYSPYGSNKEILIGRQQYILDLMVEQEYISKEQAEEAKAFPLEFKEPGSDMQAPHFVMMVKEQLSEKYGEKMVEQGGLKITTTLDLYKQKIAEEVVTERTMDYTETYHASNAALLSIDPKTGQVLAMVGSRDYFNENIDGQYNVTTAKRQPGSSIKPLIYATLFKRGYTPNTILYDVVTNFSTGGDPYIPHNYNLKENGPVSVRKALAGSLNVPAVKALYLAGINNVIDLAEDLGYTTFGDRNRFGLSLVLGGGEVRMIEHVNAFSAFAREGIMQDTSLILKVEDSKGEVLEEWKDSPKTVLDPKIARLINDVLSDNEARSFIFGAQNWLTLGGRPVAAKTGTTNDYIDAWTVGYTPSIVTGVWVGNNDNSPMKRGADGGVIAAPIWHDYMARVLGDTPVEYFRKEEIAKTGKPVLDGEIGNGSPVRIDKTTGLLATENTPPEMIEERQYFDPHCILYYINPADPLGDAPKDPSRESQFAGWEKAVRDWFEKEKLATSSPYADVLEAPTEYDDAHKPEYAPTLSIESPNNHETITDQLLKVVISAQAPQGIARAEYYINDSLIHVNTRPPFGMEKKLNFLSNGFYNLKVRACDGVFNCTSKDIEFNLKLDNPADIQPISVTITNPSNGLALSSGNFPLPIQVTVNEPKSTARINIYYKKDEGEWQTVGAIQPIDDNNLVYYWSRAPINGTYKLYAEAVSWNEGLSKSNEVMVTITNQ